MLFTKEGKGERRLVCVSRMADQQWLLMVGIGADSLWGLVIVYDFLVWILEMGFWLRLVCF